MKPGKWLMGLVVSFAMLQACSALAAEDKYVVKVSSKDDFMAVAAAIRQQITPGGRWEYTNKLEKEQIERNLNDMQALFDKYSTVDQMNDASKMQLVNDQESINEILTKRDDNHVVCTSEAPMGALIPQRTCRTYGEMERRRHDDQDEMRRRLATPQLRGGGG